MNQQYVDTVRLLLAAAPAVFRSPRFALKGGTALNLFAHDMPRLSVDIDVVFTDHTLNREDALRAIAADLKAAKSAISAMGFRAHLPTAKGGENVKLLVEGNGQQIPAPQWKLINLRTLKKRNPGRFSAQHDELASRFANLPSSATAHSTST